MRRLSTVLVLGVALGSLLSCLPRVLPAARFHDTIPIQEGALGVHMADGDLVVLTSWSVEGDPPAVLQGQGSRYDGYRRLRATDSFRIPYDSIALVETTVPENQETMVGESLGLTGLAAFSVLTGAITLACLADPKSCFGSCPTLYDDPASDRPVAEAFSSSIARALEARDIDALPTVRSRGGQVRLTMRNEALETHAVRSLRLLAVAPGAAGVAVADGAFHQLDAVFAPTRCVAPEGDCLEAVHRPDGIERRSWTDPDDLATREVVELEFAAADGPLGLVLTARHTFVSTFVFYQTLGYLGHDAGRVLAGIERGESRYLEAFQRAATLLGEMEVLMEQDGRWVQVAAFQEAGPLAADSRLIPLPATDGPVRVRLRMARGYWRLEAAAVARVGPRVPPTILEPTSVEREGQHDPVAASFLLDPERHLVTYPGDAYELVYDVPTELTNPAFFADATGYYYEWMRQEWSEERSPLMMARFLLDPGSIFRRLAPAFKASEPHMEELFWASRFGRDP